MTTRDEIIAALADAFDPRPGRRPVEDATPGVVVRNDDGSLSVRPARFGEIADALLAAGSGKEGTGVSGERDRAHLIPDEDTTMPDDPSPNGGLNTWDF